LRPPAAADPPLPPPTPAMRATKFAVTGGSGFVGQRLVEMLVERGAERVVSFDIAPAPPGALQDPRVEYVQGDITSPDDLASAFDGCEIVFHIAALVGPYHAEDMYVKVNYQGTLNVIEACKRVGVDRVVMSSSPSTRFPYPDPNVNGESEESLRAKNGGEYAPVFLQKYAETKAMGEKAMLDACSDDFLTVAVAPHQVYGPRDGLFLPSLLEAAGEGKLFIFGDGKNKISFCHVDNYSHGLILASEALVPGSPVLGRYYVVTDGPGINFWDALDMAVTAMGFPSLKTRMYLPAALMMVVASLCMGLGRVLAFFSGKPYHTIMRRLKFTTFAVKMLVINRYFDISAAKRDFGYEPLIPFEQGWADTIEWFQENWLPNSKFAPKADTPKAA